jgi:hypothetical protein
MTKRSGVKRTRQSNEGVSIQMNEKRVFVTVSGGVAYVCEDSVPSEIKVEILDFDNIREAPAEMERLSPAARAYIRQRRWDHDV